MKNLIKMDFYRLFHSKTIYIGTFAALIISALAMLLNWGIVKILCLGGVEGEIASGTLGMFISSANWLGGADFGEIVTTGTNSLSLFICCMMSALFISEEQSYGYVKNVIGQLPSRSYIIVSKFIVTSFISIYVLAIYTLISCGMALLLFPSYITSYSIANMFGVIGLRILLFMAINSIILFLCTLTKSQSLAMVFGAIFGIGITHFVYRVAGMLLGMVKIDIDLSNIMPDSLNSLLSIDSLGSSFVRVIVISAIFIAIFLAGSITLINKRDVR